jgi:hypothetical protein
MLKFQIDDIELEETIQQNYGENTDVLVKDFAQFLKQRQIKEDIAVSIKQLDKAEGMKIAGVMEVLRSKYE